MMKKSGCRLGGAHAPFLEFGGKGEVALSCVLPLGGKLFFWGGEGVAGLNHSEGFLYAPYLSSVTTKVSYSNNKSFVQ